MCCLYTGCGSRLWESKQSPASLFVCLDPILPRNENTVLCEYVFCCNYGEMWLLVQGNGEYPPKFQGQAITMSGHEPTVGTVQARQQRLSEKGVL